MVSNEVKWAQKEIYKAGKELASARMRLEGTKYEKEMNKLWDSLAALNTRLVDDINK